MQITLTSKAIGSADASYTRVLLVEKGVERLVVEGKVQTLEIVAGPLKKVTRRTFRTLVRGIVQAAKKHKLEQIAFACTPAQFAKLEARGDSWLYAAIGENLLLANYDFTKYKSEQPKETLKKVLVCGSDSKEAKAGLAQGVTIATEVNRIRDIANTPGGDMTPQHLADEAKRVLKGTKATVKVLDDKQIATLKMGGVMGVGKGAKAKPRFIVIEYWGLGKGKGKSEKGKSNDGPIVFVGKGVTFDTGGLQVKPGMAMYEMHMDMSGGAAVIGAIAAIAKLGLKKNVIGLIPAVENAISDEAIRPGDVLTMMSGKTVDVLHTDAEGRLILADALHYAKRYAPRLTVDIATLTGAALVAVGQHANVIMTKSRALEDAFRTLGEESGDYVFPLPLWKEYTQYTKGVHGDIANIPAGDSKYGGTITAGAFLSHFTKGMKWVHIDMAPRMTSVGSDKLAKGATGEPTRLLIKIAETF